MAWTIDDSDPRIFRTREYHAVPSPGINKYDAWRLEIQRGDHPKTAADNVGGMYYEKLTGTELYTIRLSKEHRVLFTINNTLQQVKVISIGGHP